MPPVSVRIPSWADPQNASVLDNWWERTARTLGGMLGAADPASQAMAIGAPVELPGGAGGPGQRLLGKAIKAYHGSPHDFDQFSLGKIGTGEGGQAYGHGLYFAENPAVAGEYRNTLAKGNVELYGQKYNAPSPAGSSLDPHSRMVLRLADSRQKLGPVANDEQVVARARSKIMEAMSARHGDQSALSAELNYLNRAEAHPAGIKTTFGGKTYEVNINASPDELLDWDKPLSQQSPKVQEAAQKAGFKPVTDGPFKGRVLSPYGTMIDDPTGRHLYEELSLSRRTFAPAGSGTSAAMKHSDAVVANELKDAGIKGIQYLDQGSRGRTGGELVGVTQTPQGWQAKVRVERGGDSMFTTSTPHPTEAAARAWADKAINTGTKNFVIFDDKIIEIAKKYGVALPVAASIYKYQQAQQK